MVLQGDDGYLLELDPRVVEDVLRCHKELEDAGQLFTRQQLAEYYQTFRNKFGPEQLALLDGETLLKAMHDFITKDSLLLLSLLHFDVQNVTGLGLLPDEPTWEWMVVSKLLPLFLLCGSVLLVDIKPLLKRLRRPVLTGS